MSNLRPRSHFTCCLQRRKWGSWHQEDVARAQYRFSQVLKQRSKHAEAHEQYQAAKKVKDYSLAKYPEYLKDDPSELGVYDQMVSLWAGRKLC